MTDVKATLDEVTFKTTVR